MPASLYLAVPKSPDSDQELPLYSSVSAALPDPGVPPKAKAAVVVPLPPRPYLAVVKSLTSDHEVPL